MNSFKIPFIVVLSIVFNCDSFCQDLSLNLLVNYNFENNYLDESANGFHGINSQTLFTPDRFGIPGSAALFNGNSFVETPNVSALKPDFPFSMACWIFPQVEFARAEGVWANDQELNNYYGAFVSILANGKIMAGYGDGCGTTDPMCRRTFVTDDFIENDKWYHLAVNFLSPNEIDVYINGCLVPSSFNGSGSTTMAYSDEPGALGKKDHSDIIGNPIGYYNGVIDDFFFWDRIFTLDDLSLLIGDFFEQEETIVTHVGCHNDGFEISINGVTYNESNPNGIEFISTSFGCDSIVIVDLEFSSSLSEVIEYEGCSGDGFEVMINSVLYNEDNPKGEENLLSLAGCDSMVIVEMEFIEPILEVIEYEGCVGDGYEIYVNSTLYDENNPSGQEDLLTQEGCDSIIIVDLKYLDNQCSYFVPNVFALGSNDPNNRFKIGYSSECEPRKLETFIYDRWGNLIFYSNEIDFEWRGDFNGKSVTHGIYTYLIKIENHKSNFTLSGDVLFLK